MSTKKHSNENEDKNKKVHEKASEKKSWREKVVETFLTELNFYGPVTKLRSIIIPRGENSKENTFIKLLKGTAGAIGGLIMSPFIAAATPIVTTVFGAYYGFKLAYNNVFQKVQSRAGKGLGAVAGFFAGLGVGIVNGVIGLIGGLYKGVKSAILSPILSAQMGYHGNSIGGTLFKPWQRAASELFVTLSNTVGVINRALMPKRMPVSPNIADDSHVDEPSINESIRSRSESIQVSQNKTSKKDTSTKQNEIVHGKTLIYSETDKAHDLDDETDEEYDLESPRKGVNPKEKNK